jgi:hypothetical protein
MKKNMNSRLTIELMEQLHFFDSEMFEILKSHGIKNIQNLIDADLSKWNGLETQRKIELEEAKVWYDLSRLEKEEIEDNSMERVNNNYKNIKLNSLWGVIDNSSFRYLTDHGIKTVGKFLNSGNMIASIGSGDVRLKKDLLIAYKLLSCKYLDIDPEMEIKDDDTMLSLARKLGFRTKTYKAFVASGLSPKELISIVMNNYEEDAYNKLLEIKDVGKTMAYEVIFKITIVENYYGKKNKTISDNKSNDVNNDDLLVKYFEMLEESKRIKELDAKLDDMLESMLSEMASKGLLTDEVISKHLK